MGMGMGMERNGKDIAMVCVHLFTGWGVIIQIHLCLK